MSKSNKKVKITTVAKKVTRKVKILAVLKKVKKSPYEEKSDGRRNEERQLLAQ
jgi:hypothetical protein